MKPQPSAIFLSAGIRSLEPKSHIVATCEDKFRSPSRIQVEFVEWSDTDVVVLTGYLWILFFFNYASLSYFGLLGFL